ncbi:alpha/beta hydrolase [Pyxidicoccus trucidator]|uniref:alpha/beta hydrolase n=1 Tax=Pyxidicoccus trucidator TaxID=2709662 RepID=UPI0013DB757D|nr:dienelactone hydrolase family protein [Pyxidicoccus trucidator]
MKRSGIAALLVLTALCMGCAGTRPGPEAAAASQALKHETYTLGGKQPDAMLVALHYSGATPAFWHEFLKDWGAPVRVLLPQGPNPRREGFTWVPTDHEQKDEAAKTADLEQMAERVAQLIREARRAHPELRRVAVTGFSYGGDLAWLLAIRYPDLVDAAAPMGSRLLGEPAQALPDTRRVLVLHGEADAIIDFQKTVARVEALKARGVPIELRGYPDLGHDMSPQLIEDWRTFLRQQLSGTAHGQEPGDAR